MRNKVYFKPLLLIAALGVFTSVSNAEVYKWVDAEGETHYTQSPPPGDIEATTIKPPPEINPEDARQRQENRLKLLQETGESRDKAAEEKLKLEQESAEKKAACEQARARLASYERPRINMRDKDGNLVRVGEETRQAELAKSRELISKLCQ